MKYALFFLLMVTGVSHADLVPRAKVFAMRDDIHNRHMLSLAEHSDRALDGMIRVSTQRLQEEGFTEEAYFLQGTWDAQYKGYLTKLVLASRVTTRDGISILDIGDHQPLIQWLATAYALIELKLGVATCVALHISDIKTMNFCIPVVFSPCTFKMDSVTGGRKEEYNRHFSQGEVYYGLVPVITYWVLDISCIAGTSGIATMLCMPVSSAAEYFMGKYVAPKLSDFIFDKACS